MAATIKIYDDYAIRAMEVPAVAKVIGISIDGKIKTIDLPIVATHSVISEVDEMKDSYSVSYGSGGTHIPKQWLRFGIVPTVGMSIIAYKIRDMILFGIDLDGKRMRILDVNHFYDTGVKQFSESESESVRKKSFINKLFQDLPAAQRHWINMFRFNVERFAEYFEFYEISMLTLANNFEKDKRNNGVSHYQSSKKTIADETGKYVGKSFSNSDISFASAYAHKLSLDIEYNAMVYNEFETLASRPSLMLGMDTFNFSMASRPIVDSPLYPREKYLEKYIKSLTLQR